MRLLVIEDEAALGAAMAAHLAMPGHAVDHLGDLGAAEAAIAATDYDLILLDLGLPDGDGLAFLRRLRAAGRLMPVLITTARDRITQRIEGLKAGADDYLVKPFDLDEMAARAEAILRRAHADRAPERVFGALSVDPVGHKLHLAGREVELTRREWALIDRLSARPDAVVSKSDLEDTLYGFGNEVESNAIEAHVSRLRAKLGKDAVVTVRGLGYRMGRVAG